MFLRGWELQSDMNTVMPKSRCELSRFPRTLASAQERTA